MQGITLRDRKLGQANRKDSWVNPLLSVFTGAIGFYQRRISVLFPPRCKYHPSCSSYALQALKRHGIIKGLLLSIWRLLRCNPFSDGGVDQVPELGKWKKPTYKRPSTAELEIFWSELDAKEISCTPQGGCSKTGNHKVGNLEHDHLIKTNIIQVNAANVVSVTQEQQTAENNASALPIACRSINKKFGEKSPVVRT